MSAKNGDKDVPERRRMLVRERAIPPDAPSRAELVRALTRTINRIEAHVRAGANWRNRRQLDALRRAVDARGTVLELLRVDAPTVWDALVTELQLEVPKEDSCCLHLE